jgi:VWFA-related protein
MKEASISSHSRGTARYERYAYRFCLLLAGIVALLGISSAQQVASPGVQGEPYVINVNVNMVALHATVLDHKNVPVAGLSKESFQVFEDGVPQQITQFSHEDIPVTVGLVVDNSGSMGNKRSHVIAAALAFARSSNPQDQMFVVNFNERVSFALPPSAPFTDNVQQLEVALSTMRASGETALYDAIAAALGQLGKGNRDKKVLIIISDGGDNASKLSLARVMTLAQQSTAVIYSIGIFDEHQAENNPGVLRKLAESTGGETFLPESLTDVGPICERIAHDIRSQYSLSYVPRNGEPDGKYRTIRVDASAPGRGRLRVRTRTGYLPPAPNSASSAEAKRHDLR